MPHQPSASSGPSLPSPTRPVRVLSPPSSAEYRIEELAHLSGATVRTIRAYQDRGLLPRPERRGRANVYADGHLTRLRQIAELLDRGYTLASIKELLEAWDSGRGLGGVLGLVSQEAPDRESRDTGRPAAGEPTDRGPSSGTARPATTAHTEAIPLPTETVRAVSALVGRGNTVAFITAAAEREVRARAMDTLVAEQRGPGGPHGASPP